MKTICIKYTRFLLPLLFLFAAIGCENQPTEVSDYTPEPMLHAYLSTGELFSEIKLEWVDKNIGGVYSPEANGITGAEILIYPLRDDYGTVIDSAGKVVRYTDKAGRAGAYVTNSTQLVQPLTCYRLIAKKTGVLELSAETMTPDTFDLRFSDPALQAVTDVRPADSLHLPIQYPRYNRELNLIDISWSDAWRNVNYNSRPRGGYLFGQMCLVAPDSLIPLDPDWDPTDPNDALTEEQRNERAGMMFVTDYQRSLSLFWGFFTFSGPHRLDAMAVSYEYYRYLFSTWNSDGTERPESNVHGGLGCFGAYTRHYVFLEMVRVTR